MDIDPMVHGDDLLVVGSAKALQWTNQGMRKKYEIKAQVLGPDHGMEKEVKMLNRILRWTSKGIEYEPDQRHAELVIQELGLEGCKPVDTPGCSDAERKTREEQENL